MRVRQAWLRWVLGAYVVIVGLMALVVVVSHRQGELDGALQDVYNTTGSRLTGLVSIGAFMLWTAAIAIALFAAGLLGVDDIARSARKLLFGAAAITVVFLIDDVLALHELFGRFVGQAIGQEDRRGLIEAIPLAWLGLLLLAFAWMTRRTTAALRLTPLLVLVFAWLGLSVSVDLVPESVFSRLAPGGDDGAEGLQTAIEELCKLLGIVTWVAFISLAGRRAILRRDVRAYGPGAEARPG